MRIEHRHFSPPRSPNLMVGKQQVADFLRQIRPADFGIIMADEVICTDRIAFSVAGHVSGR